MFYGCNKNGNRNRIVLKLDLPSKYGFHNDTTPRYDAEAAKLAWERTLGFFKKNLK